MRRKDWVARVQSMDFRLRGNDGAAVSIFTLLNSPTIPLGIGVVAP
jgi:hypothetical protein